MGKNKLLKFKILPNLNMILSMELMRYCIKNKVAVNEVVEESLCKYIKVDRQKIKKKTDEYSQKIRDDFGTWGTILAEYNKLDEEYKKIQNGIKDKEKAIRLKYQKLAEKEIQELRKG